MWPVAGRDVRAAIGGDGGEAADEDVFTGVAVGGAWQAGDAFFALDLGEDGHALADRYLAAGGKLAVVSAQGAGPRTIRVGDVLGAFKRLAGFMRARMSWPLVAVGGANGKTTTKDMIAAVLSGGGRRVVATEGTENGHFGVPLTLLDRRNVAGTEALVVEVGIDAVGAMRGHAELLRPDYVVLASLGEEHLAGLHDEATATREELALLSTGAVRIEPAACNVGAFDGSGREVSFGTARVFVPMPGEHHARLAALAVSVGFALGRTEREIEQGFATFRPPPGRAEIVRLGRDVVLVDDAFNANPPSVRAALDLLAEPVWAHRPKAVVLGDMLDLGEATERAHLALVPRLAALAGAHVRLFGDAMGAVFRALKDAHGLGSLAHAPSAADPVSLLDGVWGSLEGAVVLVKGSRGMRLERVSRAIARAYARPRPLPAAPAFGRDFLTVGVTGTNGKTSTTTWIAAMLARVQPHVVRATTLGYFLDDAPLDHPLDFDGFVAALGEAHARGARACALEVTSEALHHGFAKIWPFQVGVFTNLTHDHLDVHTTPEHYLASKAQLFMNLAPGGTAVLNACDPASELLREIVPDGVRVMQYGVASRGEPRGATDLFASRTENIGRSTRVVLANAPDGFPDELRLPFVGDVFVENALAAALGALAAGVPVGDVVAALEALVLPPGRFEIISDAPRVVIDYAHTPDALSRVIAAARKSTRGRVLLVFGAGGDRDTRKRGPMGHAATAADVVYVTSDNPRTEDPASIAKDITDGMGAHDVIIELDRARAIGRAIEEAHADDVVLLCGKGHETHQTIGETRRPFSDRDVALAALSACTAYKK